MKNFLTSKHFRFLLGIIIVLGVIYIFRAGHQFGQWLYQINHR